MYVQLVSPYVLALCKQLLWGLAIAPLSPTSLSTLVSRHEWAPKLKFHYLLGGKVRNTERRKFVQGLTVLPLFLVLGYRKAS